METVFRIKATDLNLNFLNALKSLFKKDEEIELQISSRRSFGVLKAETQTECNTRIEKSFNNLKMKKNIVTFTGKEFETFTQMLIKK